MELVGGYRGDAEFGRHRVDRVLRDVEVDLAIGGEVWADVALVMPLRFITRQSVEERGDVIDGQTGLFRDCPESSLVGSNQRLHRGTVQRDMGRIHSDSRRGDLEVIADPGQQSEPLFPGDLFGGEGAAYVGGVDGTVPKTAEVHLVVTRFAHHTFHVAVRVEAVLTVDDPAKATGSGMGGRLPDAVREDPPWMSHRCHPRIRTVADVC
jgi:hypothetical protein